MSLLPSLGQEQIKGYFRSVLYILYETFSSSRLTFLLNMYLCCTFERLIFHQESTDSTCFLSKPDWSNLGHFLDLITLKNKFATHPDDRVEGWKMYLLVQALVPSGDVFVS